MEIKIENVKSFDLIVIKLFVLCEMSCILVSVEYRKLYIFFIYYVCICRCIF